jgi:hypothetical protein
VTVVMLGEMPQVALLPPLGHDDHKHAQASKKLKHSNTDSCDIM